MAVDRTNDLEALNAFVDGELSASARAAMAARIAAEPDLARAHAVLTRLRAGVADYADTVAPPPVAVAARRRLSPLAAAVAAAAVLMALAFFGADRPALEATPPDAAVHAVALGSKPMIPDLSAAGMTLLRVDGGVERPFERLTAVYRGPRGCRLELHVRGAGEAPPAATQATRRHVWSDGALVYELLAFGMPAERFAAIAAAAERQTRDPQGGLLREARADAAPCLG